SDEALLVSPDLAWHGSRVRVQLNSQHAGWRDRHVLPEIVFLFRDDAVPVANKKSDALQVRIVAIFIRSQLAVMVLVVFLKLGSKWIRSVVAVPKGEQPAIHQDRTRDLRWAQMLPAPKAFAIVHAMRAQLTATDGYHGRRRVRRLIEERRGIAIHLFAGGLPPELSVTPVECRDVRTHHLVEDQNDIVARNDRTR